jgi:hypothetical protein
MGRTVWQWRFGVSFGDVVAQANGRGVWEIPRLTSKVGYQLARTVTNPVDPLQFAEFMMVNQLINKFMTHTSLND